jgi:hypothetical protein
MKMNRKPLIEAAPLEAHQFTEAFPAMPQFAQREPVKGANEVPSALVPKPTKAAIDPAEKKELPAWVPFIQKTPDELPSTVLGRRTFRLPQRLIEDLVGAGELRAFAWLDHEGNIWRPIS